MTGGLGDRRLHPRFDVSGLEARLDTWELMRVANLGRGGALLEAADVPPLGAESSAELVVDGEAIELRVRVNRVMRAPVDARLPYLVGIEFLYVSAPQVLNTLMGLAGSIDPAGV